MATINARTTGIQPKGLRVGLNAMTKVYSVVASISAGDVIQMIDVPKGATPVYVAFAYAAGIGTMNVGDGVSAARYISNYLNSANAVTAPINTAYSPYTYSTDDTIDVTISAISAGGSATTGAMIMTCIFGMDAV